MTDYTYPSIFFSYIFFATSFGVALFFLIRSIKDGYWGRDSEEIKHEMLRED